MAQPKSLALLSTVALHEPESPDDGIEEALPTIHLDALILRQVSGSLPAGLYARIKKFVEPGLAVLMLVAALPIILIAALLVKLTSRGPAFYSQTRVGHNGRVFRIYKLRTMIDNCESLTGPRWAIPGDPRITPIGHLLRVTHIDEFPQLWNVVCGDMSLIGPRPERPEFVEHLEQAIPSYSYRQAVAPGITGLAQVQLPADSGLRSVQRKLLCDLYYIEQMNPWLDLRILVCTGFKFLGIPFSIADRLLHLPRYAAIEKEFAQTAAAIREETRTAQAA